MEILKDKNEMILVDKVSVRISKRFTLGPVSLNIPKKSVVGLIGANGSGKSIFLNTLVGLIKPTTGFVSLFTKNIGFALQSPTFYGNKTLIQNLIIFSKFYNVSITELLMICNDLDITSLANHRLKRLSLGNQKRYEFASSIAGNPELLILDEPTAYVDENGIRLMKKLIEREIEKGKTVLITNHQSFELDKICSHFLLLNNGKVVDFTIKENFLNQYKSVNNAIQENS